MLIKKLAEEYATAWRKAIVDGDVAFFEKLFDPGFVLHGMGMRDISLEAYMKHEIEMHERARTIGWDIKYITGDRYLFALEFNGHFLFTSDLPGRPGMAGKEFNSHALCLFRVKNGKIIEEWSNTTVTGLT